MWPAALPASRFNIVLVVAIQINQLLWPAGITLQCDALRMINLDAPQMALQGDTISLTCSFSLTGSSAESSRRANRHGDEDELDQSQAETSRMAGKRLEGSTAGTHQKLGADKRFVESSITLPGTQLADEERDNSDLVARRRRRRQKDGTDSTTGELLYAIKWYKDEREFYQFVTRNWPHKHALPMSGLNIDVDKSDNQTVVLKSVSLKTSGLFRCEVSTDAPSFVTKSIERKIFIYSLPAEGPVIQTNLPRTRPNHLNLYLGEQLELRCLSRESKPNTRLDWIINETLNLTANSPKGADGLPLFKVSTRHFVRLPKLATNPESALNSHSIKAGAANRSRLAIARVPTQVYLNQQYTNNETTYELVEAASQTNARALVESEPDSVLPLGVESLDQFLETSMSLVNFTVNTDLIQYLQMYASGAPLTRTRHSKLVAQRIATSNSANGNKTSPGTSFKIKKINDDRRRSKSTGQSDIGPRLPLDIRCVARVMHLSMSDEIKLRVINSTKAALLTLSSSIEAQRQEKRVQNNSAAMLELYGSWIYLLIWFVWLKLAQRVLSSLNLLDTS